MEREQFTFYSSFAKAALKIKKPAERCAYYDALIGYALSGVEPDEDKLPEIVCMAMELVMPVLASSRRKAENGKRGGSKTEANASKDDFAFKNSEANTSKPEANPKQEEQKQSEANPKQGESASKKEDKKESKKEDKKEKENECYLSPPSPSSPSSAPRPQTATAIAEEVMQGWTGDLRRAVLDWLAYKKEKRQNYQETGLRTLLSQLRKAADTYGDAAVCEVIRNSMASGYTGITLDRLAAAAPKGKMSNSVNRAQKPLTGEAWADVLDKI